MNLLQFKYFIFVMALAGDDSTQYTVPIPHAPYPMAIFRICFLFSLFFVICFWVGVRNYL